MSAEFSYFTTSGVSVDDPILITTTYTVVIKNIGDEVGIDLGFYLQLATSDGPFEYPSTDSPATNLVDIIALGNEGEGLTITQSSTTTRFEDDHGDRWETRIPLSIGTGSNSDEIEINSSITITLSLSFPSGYQSKSFYVDLLLG